MRWWLYSVPVICFGLFSKGSWINPRILLNAFPLTLTVATRVCKGWFAGLLVASLAAMELALVAYLVLWSNVVAQP